MTKQDKIKLFEQKQVRTLWDEEAETWYFSIVDVVGVLTDNPRKYWTVLKTRLKKEGSEFTTNCSKLKMRSVDGKSYLTDVADTEPLFRLIQSIPSPKAEPFKQWMAQVASERLDHRMWKNVAVFETYAGNELSCVAMAGTDSPDLSTTLVRYPEKFTRIEAVAWDGTRTLVYGKR